MFENELPCLPVYKIHNEVEFCFKNEDVYFVLKHGVNDIVCTMKGKEITEQFEVCPQGSNPENSVDRDFRYIQLTENIVEVEQSDIDLEQKQKIELTETQYHELNEYLKEKMEIVG